MDKRVAEFNTVVDTLEVLIQESAEPLLGIELRHAQGIVARVAECESIVPPGEEVVYIKRPSSEMPTIKPSFVTPSPWPIWLPPLFVILMVAALVALKVWW